MFTESTGIAVSNAMDDNEEDKDVVRNDDCGSVHYDHADGDGNNNNKQWWEIKNCGYNFMFIASH